jgi:glycosyltransferase involved in cell wall biosynthesis
MCTVVSHQERQLFERFFPESKSKVEIVPNGINFRDYSVLKVKPKPNRLIFTGPFRYHVNYEAMQWFISEVYPKILAQLPNTQLMITGDHKNLPLPSNKNITLTGFVADIKPLIASSWISIAPLLSGGGTRLKILEAMAIGTPVVSTTKGAQGLEAKSEEHLMIADSAESFANHVVKILNDKELHARLATSARKLVSEKYDWNTLLPQFERVVRQASHIVSV